MTSPLRSPDAAGGFLAGLNEAQRRAVDHHSGPLLVVAGAGSGKTRALTHRIAHLIGHHGIEPAGLLAVTFTNKAAREMKERLETLLAQRLVQNQFAKHWGTLPASEQRQLRSRIHREVRKSFGSEHSMPSSPVCCGLTLTSFGIPRAWAGPANSPFTTREMFRT